ncbi:hypothetical protein [Rhizobium sp. 2TAF27]|uniref:hypothetical protein n=1 Tax=Rhizobium sp. 2TAF27 TaxID=3233013 RepID=UPI003F994F5F
MNSIQAMATFRDSVQAFGDAAQDQLARSGASYRVARSNMDKTYRERKAMADEFRRAVQQATRS